VAVAIVVVAVLHPVVVVAGGVERLEARKWTNLLFEGTCLKFWKEKPNHRNNVQQKNSERP
jgi:hypothetical protein